MVYNFYLLHATSRINSKLNVNTHRLVLHFVYGCRQAECGCRQRQRGRRENGANTGTNCGCAHVPPPVVTGVIAVTSGSLLWV